MGAHWPPPTAQTQCRAAILRFLRAAEIVILPARFGKPREKTNNLKQNVAREDRVQ